MREICNYFIRRNSKLDCTFVHAYIIVTSFQKRNKPREPPKAPKAAPFFLGTTRELVPKFIVEEDTIPEQKVKLVRFRHKVFTDQNYPPQS